MLGYGVKRGTLGPILDRFDTTIAFAWAGVVISLRFCDFIVYILTQLYSQYEYLGSIKFDNTYLDSSRIIRTKC